MEDFFSSPHKSKIPYRNGGGNHFFYRKFGIVGETLKNIIQNLCGNVVI